jgi:hypothetical protein
MRPASGSCVGIVLSRYAILNPTAQRHTGKKPPAPSVKVPMGRSLKGSMLSRAGYMCHANDQEFDRYIGHTHMKLRKPMRDERVGNQAEGPAPAPMLRQGHAVTCRASRRPCLPYRRTNPARLVRPAPCSSCGLVERHCTL